MSFNTGGGGGSSSVATGSDVQLGALAHHEALGYDGGNARWRNMAAPGVPDGGGIQQVLAKATAADRDVGWVDVPRFSNLTPAAGGTEQAGVALVAARADHVHPVPSGIGYPLPQQNWYANPLGASVNDTVSIPVGSIRVSPLPVYKPFRLSVVVPGLRDNVGERNMQIAVFGSHADDWTPTERIGGVISATSNEWQFPIEPKFSDSVFLEPGLYWVAVLGLAPSAISTTVVQGKSYANTFHWQSNYGSGLSTYLYPDGSFTSMPASLTSVTRVIENASPFSYYIQASRL